MSCVSPPPSLSRFYATAPLAEPGLENCAGQLPDGTVHSAPTLLGTPPAEPVLGNVYLCKRSGATAFFALEYDPERLGRNWAAYRLSDTFGADRCASVPRRHMRCFFQAPDAAACVASDQDPADPFHVESVLVDLGLPRLGANPFAGTQHDRGHMAPNNSFSWHLCGAYETCTMANMAPQRDHLNRVTWERLEAQVLYWGVTLGPIRVVTGPIREWFPEEEFEIFALEQVDRALMAQPDEPLRPGSGLGSCARPASSR